jgi:predicted DNA-binding WGR domain protein
MRRFELVDGTSSKFWEIEPAAGGELNIRWGRIGTAGQSQTKSFGDDAKAKVAMDKLIKEKTGKGYAEVGVGADEVIGRTAAAPKPAVAAPSKVAATAAAAVAAPAESLDAQCERVFEAVRSQLAQGQWVAGDKLSAAQLKRQFGISDQGAAMAFERLKDSGMLHGWGATAQFQDGAQTLAQEWTGRIAALQDAAVSGPDAHGALAAVARVGGGEGDTAPPWLAQEARPLRLDEARRQAYASRQYPAPVATLSVKEAWQRVGSQLEPSVALDASEEALRPAVQRMLDRLAVDEPAADAQADALLMALALSTTGYYGESAPAKAIVDYLVARYGLPGAVDVFLAAQQIQVDTSYSAALKVRESRFSSAVYEPLSSGWRGPFGEGDEALRAHLAAAPQDQWDVCAEAIETALPGVHPTRRPTLAMLLPERPALSNALALELTAQKDVPESAHWLLLTATDAAALAAAGKVRPGYSSGFWGDGRMVSTALLERGLAAVELLERGAAVDPAGEALSCIGTPEAVMVLARVASSSKGALARLALAVDRWPQAALVALARVVAQGGKDAGLLMPSLTRLLRAHPQLVDPLRPWLDSSAQATVDRQLALLAGPKEVAEPDDLPPLLVAPPWRAKVQKKAQQELSLSPLALPPVEQWDEGAREAALGISSWEKARHDKARANLPDLLDLMGFEANSWYGLRDAQKKALWEKSVQAAREVVTDALRCGDGQVVAATWRQVHELRKQLCYSWYAFNGDAATLVPRSVGLTLWNSVAGEAETRDAAFVMASLGLEALPGLVSVVRSRPTENLSVARHFGAVELAPMAARALAKLKSVRELGRRWLLRYPEHAACALIAPALGKRGEARDCAGTALRLLQAHGHEALLLEVAARHGDPAAVDGVRAVLDESPLDRFPTRRSKLPGWWQPRGWRRPQLLNGKALPDSALDVVGEMMGFPTAEEVYAGIGVLRELCESNSLADFAWDAFSAWLEAGGPSKDGWALTALGLLGTDDTARRLTPFIRAWPGESAHARAVTGLDVLAGIGTDVALMLLNGIAQKVKFKGLQDKAREKIDTIAEARGLSTEELEDRLAPDLGLDERGSLVLDFGPRAFRVAFDESLKPFVREVGEGGALGARLPDLPKPKKTDDGTMAKEAVERFKLLKKDARTIASQQLLRLEVAMCARRRWTPELFRLFLVEHPLVRYIVQRLVWGVYEVPEGGNYGGALRACFRVAEDGSFTTAEDDAFDLPEGEHLRIGVPHALELPAAEAAAFGQVFADYELLQPFAQIGRDPYTLDEAEKPALKLLRWNGVKVPTGKVLGLVNKGWRRGQAQDSGCIWYFTKPLGAGKVIELQLDPGIIVGMVDEYPEQTLGDVQVGEPAAWGDIRHPEAFSKLDDIAASELIRDLEALRG